MRHTPDYPLQLMLGVFDFPDRAPAGEVDVPEVDVPVPELVVRRVVGRAAPAG